VSFESSALIPSVDSSDGRDDAFCRPETDFHSKFRFFRRAAKISEIVFYVVVAVVKQKKNPT
jgi:hypothetical protein